MLSLKFLPLLGLIYSGCNANTDNTSSPLLEEGGVTVKDIHGPEDENHSVNNALGVDLQQALALTKEIEEIEEKVKYFSLRKSERVWEKIPWVTDFKTAKALSEKTNRPIFLFSMWGELDGRC